MRISDWSSDVCSSDLHQDKILPYPRQLQEIGAPATILGRIEGDIENGVLPAGQSVGLIHAVKPAGQIVRDLRSEEHTSEFQSLMRITYAVFCVKKIKTEHVRGLITNDNQDVTTPHQ